jgi:TatD DNase family protein
MVAGLSMFDSHCHLHDTQVGDLADVWLERARAAEVRGFLLAGVAPATWADQAAIAERHSDVWAAYGIHPQVVAELSRDAALSSVDALEHAVAAPAERLVAIGEIGLDRFTNERKRAIDLQTEIFRAQLAIARARDLPVVLHVLDAHGQTLTLLKRDGVPHAGGVVHSYSGSAELVRDYVALGLCISFAGALTSPNARRARAAARAVPRERLLVETDAPFQTPSALRPALNEPAFLPLVTAAIAELRGEPEPEVRAYTDENARRLFRTT